MVKNSKAKRNIECPDCRPINFFGRKFLERNVAQSQAIFEEVRLFQLEVDDLNTEDVFGPRLGRLERKPAAVAGDVQHALTLERAARRSQQ